MNDVAGLKLLGKVKASVLYKEQWQGLVINGKREWFFVDYAADDFPLNSKFDCMFSGDEKKLVPEMANIQLWAVVDQLGNSLDVIPKGYKMFGLFEFRPQIPDAINKLPVLQTWKYNPEAITIMNHEAVRLEIPDLFLKDFYKVVFVLIKEHFRNRAFTKTDLVELFNNLQSKSVSPDLIMADLQSLGYLREKDEGHLILSEPEAVYRTKN